MITSLGNIVHPGLDGKALAQDNETDGAENGSSTNLSI